MQPSTILAILATAATASASCYNSAGGQWFGVEGKELARGFIDQICTSGGVAGDFTAQQEKVSCHTVTAETTFNFAVKWTAPGGLDNGVLSDADCKERLKNEVNGCHAGGKSHFGGWEFMSDANVDKC
ncbi:hypothetical protein BDV95DRAFT_605891 [Massariosphaeria phaeospora]|uniref:Secreted protein n=1 Tax=Massariosphaeria phaeospora TaxID=100035 RepID=A0A7C8M8V9_9PLEO|nr:hypothetical protein BDV95DRAFT_605891 [Massariosphaeria phaeospora]